MDDRTYRPLTQFAWNLAKAWGSDVLLYVWDDIPETTQISIGGGDPD